VYQRFWPTLCISVNIFCVNQRLHVILQVNEPPRRKTGVRVSSVEELVVKLHEEAKVI
jgi:hypothetical protein